MGISQPVTIVGISQSNRFVYSNRQILANSPYRVYQSGGMYLGASTVTSAYSYQNRITNLDTETISEIRFEFASVQASTAPILGMAISLSGTGDSPGVTGWRRITFNGGNNGFSFQNIADIDNPEFISSDPLVIPEGWNPGAGMLVRLTVGTGLWSYATKAIATEIGWPSPNRRSLGDYSSTDAALSATPTWYGTTYNPTWYGITVKRQSPTPFILVHGDSLTCQTRPVAATNSTAGYGWIMKLNEATEKYHVMSCGHGGTTLTNAKNRTPEILAKYKDRITHMMVQSWSGNDAPANVGQTSATKNNIMAMETLATEAGVGFIVITLKPHGGTISTADEIAAYNEMRSWCTARYGIRHIDLGDKVSLSSNGGLTLLNSEDNVHFNATGQAIQATEAKPLIDAALSAEGYSV